MAASLTKFAKSAPLKPGVCFAIFSISTSLSSGLPLEWTSNIAFLPIISGLSRVTLLSNLPGLKRAGSRISGLFVDANTITFVEVSNPSISTRIWFRVCSLSSWPPPRPAPLCLPTASISSTNTIHGECFLACSKRSRTLEAPTPTNISTNSEPLIEKNGTPASPATARANKVFPVPGGPTRSTPLGILAPNDKNLSGFFRNSTTSSNSCFASVTPATSEKVTVALAPTNLFALLLPNPNALLAPPWACLIMKMSIPPKRINGRKLNMIEKRPPKPLEPCTSTW